MKTKEKNTKTLLERVNEESAIYKSAEEAAIDHLTMAESHLFEEFEGRDVSEFLSQIKQIRQKLEKFLKKSK